MAEANDKNGCRGAYLSKGIWSIFNKQIATSRAHLLFWPVFLTGLVSDLWTKSFVFNWLGSQVLPQCSVINGFFRFILIENRGAAWGIAAGKTGPLILISLVAIVIVFAVFLLARKHCAIIVFSLALLAAGILGNLYDRVFNNGRVRDFLDFYYGDWHFPAFNIADSMLTVAVFLLILTTIFSQKQQEE